MVTNEQLALQIEELRRDLSLNGERKILREIAPHLPAIAKVSTDLVPLIPDLVHMVETQRSRAAFTLGLRRVSRWDHGTRTFLFCIIGGLCTAASAVIVWHVLGPSSLPPMP